jgi:hypothetical protein
MPANVVTRTHHATSTILTLDAESPKAVMALPPDERRDRAKVNEAVAEAERANAESSDDTVYDDPHYVQCRWCGKWINGSDPARVGGGAPRSLTTSDSAGHRVEGRRRLMPGADQANQRSHRSLGGCNSPFIQACTSDNRMGSTSSHRTHWNVRRPDFKTMKCMALRHSGQVGGAGSGWFSAITLTLDSGASTH